MPRAKSVANSRQHVGDRIRNSRHIAPDSMALVAALFLAAAIDFSNLPTRLYDARDVSLKSKLAETEPAHLKLAKVAPRPPAAEAPVPVADLQFRFPDQLCHLACTSH